ncbi:MAG: hypothetical protein ACOH1Y_11580 [Propionicimonas sp.]
MMSYKVIDRDRARVMEEIDLARQIEPSPIFRQKVHAHDWFRSSLLGREAIRTHLSSF